MSTIPKLARVASILAFVTALFVAAGALLGPIAAMPFALVPLCAGIGIWRGRAWSAWGYGIFVLAQLPLLPLTLYRAADRAAAAPGVIGSALFSLLLGSLYLAAGRSLARKESERGRALPWIVVSAITVLPLIFFEPFVIPTGAMEPTILVGDRIFVQRIPRDEPHVNDMFALSYPVDHKQTFVKRIVGMPGDRIRISNKILYRNGVAQNENWVVHKTDYQDLYRDNFPSQPNAPVYPQAQQMLERNVVHGEVVVPPGKYFMLGDNRDQSLDSRYWGFVSQTELIGRPLLVYDSADQSTEQLSGGEKVSFPRHTRWNTTQAPPQGPPSSRDLPLPSGRVRQSMPLPFRLRHSTIRTGAWDSCGALPRPTRC